jgi:hypothetical protein
VFAVIMSFVGRAPVIKSYTAVMPRTPPLPVSLARRAAHQSAPSRMLMTRDMRRRLGSAIRCCNNKETGTISQAAVKAAKVRLSIGADDFNSNTPNALRLLLKLTQLANTPCHTSIARGLGLVPGCQWCSRRSPRRRPAATPLAVIPNPHPPLRRAARV